MIRFGKFNTSLRFILASVLVFSFIVAYFFVALVPSAEAVSVITCANNTVEDERAAAAISAGRVIYVCGYDGPRDGNSSEYQEVGTPNGTIKKPTKYSKIHLSWEYQRRFYTLSEAFWYIHSGGLGSTYNGKLITTTANQNQWQKEDWVIIVKGLQQFKYISSGEPSLKQIRRGINALVQTDVADEENKVTTYYSYGIEGRTAFTETLVRGSSTSDDYTVSSSWKSGTSMDHTGTWYITGIEDKSTTNLNNFYGTEYGSQIYFNCGGSCLFTTGGPVHFSNIDLISNKNVHFYSEEGFYVGENVKTPDYTYNGSTGNRYMFSVYAGPAHTKTLTITDTSRFPNGCAIVLSSGNWRTIMAGGNRGNIDGSVTVSLYGSARVYSNITAGYFNTISGDVNIYLANEFTAYLYPSPRSTGTVTGKTNIYLLNGATVMSLKDVGWSSATKMGVVNVTIEKGARLLECTAKWSHSNLNSNSVTANLILDGIHGGFSDKVSLEGFDSITLTNGAKVSYYDKLLTNGSLKVESGCTLYLSGYSDSSKLPGTKLTNDGTIKYVLVYYVDQNSRPTTVNYKYISNFSAEQPTTGQVSLGVDGYTPTTAFQSLAAAYDAANRSAAAKVPCQFIISGNTTENSLMGAVYSELSDNHITISAINNAVLTLGSGVNFGYVTTLENITINATEFYSGKHLTVDTGTVFSNGASTQIYAGLSDRDCTTAGDITLNTGSVSAVYLGNDAYSVADYTLNVNGGAYAGIVYCGASKNTGNLTVNINGTAAGNGAYNVGWITTTPYNPNGVVTGNVTVNFTRGAMSNDIKLYGDYYTSNGTQVDTRANSGTVSGDIVVNLSDEFVYEYNSMFYNKPYISDTKYGIITLNLSGWTRQITAKDVGLMSNIDTLGAVSETYNGTTTATNAICYESLASTQLISNVNDTSQYAAKISAAADNTVYFHHPDYDTYTATTNSTGVLYFGHQFPVDANSTYVKSAQYATKTTHGWVEYGQCSLCGKYFASSDDGTVKYTARANADSASASTACTLESCYRYWYDVYLYSVGIDGGGGGIYEFVVKSGVEYEDNCCGADERLLNGQQIKANAYDYYTFAYWYWDGTSVQASNSTTFTLNIDQVKQHSNANRQSDLVAVFSRKLGNMQIVRNGATDATQVFVFKITYDTSKIGTEAAGPTLYVTIVGNGSVTINDIPQGNYIVSQDNTWSWRYSNGAVKLAVIGTNPANYTVTYSAGPTRHNWLHGNSGLLCR